MHLGAWLCQAVDNIDDPTRPFAKIPDVFLYSSNWIENICCSYFLSPKFVSYVFNYIVNGERNHRKSKINKNVRMKPK